MAEVEFYPTKRKRDRVMFSADELELLCQIVRERIVAMTTPLSEADTLSRLFWKLARARDRTRAY